MTKTMLGEECGSFGWKDREYWPGFTSVVENLTSNIGVPGSNPGPANFTLFVFHCTCICPFLLSLLHIFVNSFTYIDNV